MTDKEQEILSLYLKDLRKKRIIIVLILVCIIIIGVASIKKYVLSSNENVMLDENITNENTISETEKTTKNENIIEKTKESEKEKKEEKQETKETEEEINTEVQIKEIEKENKKADNSNSNNKQEEQKTEKTSSKPSSKDFLFTDGYTMENVTQAAQDYVTSRGYAGECTPIQDNDGVYLGMRVTFY